MSLDALVAGDNRTETMSTEMPLSSFSLQQQQEGRVHYDIRAVPDSAVCYTPVAVFDNQSLAKRIDVEDNPKYASKRIIEGRQRGLSTYEDASRVGSRKTYILVPKRKGRLISPHLNIETKECRDLGLVPDTEITVLHYFVEINLNVFDQEMRERILERTPTVTLNGVRYYLKEHLDKYIEEERSVQYEIREQKRKKYVPQVYLLDSPTLAEKLGTSLSHASDILHAVKGRFISYEASATKLNSKKRVLVVPAGAEKLIHPKLEFKKNEAVTLELLAEYEIPRGTLIILSQKQLGDSVAEEQLIQEYKGLLYSIAYSFYPKFPSSVYEVSDLVQVAVEGLLHAVRTYDSSKGASLKHWIRNNARGYLLSEFYRRSGKNKLKSQNPAYSHLLHIENALGHRLKRIPTIAEVAERAGVREERARMLLEPVRFVSLDSPVPGGPEKGSYHDIIYDDEVQLPDAQAERVYDAEKLRDAMSQLSEREQHILRAFYFEEQSSTDIGKKMNLSGARVRQIKDEAVDELRKRINPKLRKVNAVRRTSLPALLQ